MNLIESKPLGIFALLDEQCNFPQGSDENFVQKVAHTHSKNSYFTFPKVQKRPHFIVKHYAGQVTYFAEGFLNKNKDKLQSHLYDRLVTNANPFVKSLFKDMNINSKQTVVEQFKNQLNSLIQTLQSTQSHYVRCISPNNRK